MEAGLGMPKLPESVLATQKLGCLWFGVKLLNSIVSIIRKVRNTCCVKHQIQWRDIFQSVCIGVADSNSASPVNSGRGGLRRDCSADGKY